jgi:hypothetical protein
MIGMGRGRELRDAAGTRPGVAASGRERYWTETTVFASAQSLSRA